MQDEGPGSPAAGGKQEWWLRSWLTSSTSSVGAAGAELGLWNFLATSFQVGPCRPPALMELSGALRERLITGFAPTGVTVTCPRRD